MTISPTDTPKILSDVELIAKLREQVEAWSDDVRSEFQFPDVMNKAADAIERLCARTSGMMEENTNDLFDAIEKAFVSATKGHDKARIVPDDLDCHMLARIASSVAASQLSQGNGAEELRETAAKACDAVSSEVSRAERKSNAYSEGFSDGADECASRIRALPIPPAAKGETTEEEVEAALVGWGEHVSFSSSPNEVLRDKIRSALLAARKVRE